MTRIVQISAIGVGAGKMVVFCLMEDGQMTTYDAIENKWNPITMPTGYDKAYVGAVATTLLPTGFELVSNNRTKTWTWRKAGSQAVSPPAIKGEVGEIFDTKDDAINDCKQRYLLQATETPP